MRQKLSRNFYLDEFTRSQTAARHSIDNMPNTEHQANLIRLCDTVLQPIRDALGPITISSGYRSPVLNRRVGGSGRSQHCLGQAADIHVAGLTAAEAAQEIPGLGLPFDQLILEFDQWVHISISDAPGKHPRGQVLTARRVDGKTRYFAGLAV